VDFRAYELRGLEAEQVLCAQAKQHVDVLRGVDDTGRGEFKAVLDKCAGIPLERAVAGRAIAGSVTRAAS
jgi:hypothetical protein